MDAQMHNPHRDSLNDLPVELHTMIVHHMCGYSIWPPWCEQKGARDMGLTQVSTSLIPLGSVSRYWRDLVLPYVFREVNLISRSNADLGIFSATIATKYGGFCRSLSLSLRTSDEENEDAFHLWLSCHDHDDFHSLADGESEKWHARRSTLLSLAVVHMPKIEHLKISTSECPWHEYLEFPCKCLNAYDNLLEVLDVSHLDYFCFDFGSTHFSGGGSDKIASILLRNSKTLRVVLLTRDCEDNRIDDNEFYLADTLRSLTTLSHLSDLELSLVCTSLSFSEIFSACQWQSPLSDLAVTFAFAHYPDETSGSISAALASLPSTLQHLSLLYLEEMPEAYSSPYPSHLTALRSFTCSCPDLSQRFIEFLRPGTFDTLRILFGDEDGVAADNLFDALGTKSTFPNLSVLQFAHRSLSTHGEEEWFKRCKERGIYLLPQDSA